MLATPTVFALLLLLLLLQLLLLLLLLQLLLLQLLLHCVFADYYARSSTVITR